MRATSDFVNYISLKKLLILEYIFFSGKHKHMGICLNHLNTSCNIQGKLYKLFLFV